MARPSRSRVASWRSLGVVAWVASMLGSLLTVGGCAGGGELVAASALDSGGERFVDRVELQTALYSAADRTQADFVFSDLPVQTLELVAAGSSDAAVTGRVAHVRLLLAPDPGRTPIADTAVNCTIRYLVLAPGARGVYAGGGFMRPSGTLGVSTLLGRIDGGTLRIVAGSPRFNDRLRNASFAGQFRAEHDPAAARRAIAAFDQLERGVRRVDERGSSAAP